MRGAFTASRCRVGLIVRSDGCVWPPPSLPLALWCCAIAGAHFGSYSYDYCRIAAAGSRRHHPSTATGLDCFPALLPLVVQGKDIKSGGRNTRHKHRTAPKSENIYIKLLVKVRAALMCFPACFPVCAP